MGVLSMIVKLPFLPIEGVIKLGELLRDQVDQELRSPAAIRTRLEEIDRARRTGEISEEEAAEMMRQVVALRLGPPAGP